MCREVLQPTVPAQNHGRWKAAQGTVRTFVVVHPHPSLCDLACLPEAIERIGVQIFLPVVPVEAFHVGVLALLSFLNIHKIYVVVFASLAHRLCHELRPIVHTDLLGFATPLYELGELAYHPGASDAVVQRDMQRLVVVVHRGAQVEQGTRASQTHFGLGSGVDHQLPFFSWRQSFFSMMSLSTRFSSAMSAYMRLNWDSSDSSSLSRLSLIGCIPAYFLRQL